MAYLALASQCLIGLLFGVSAVSKMRGSDPFTRFAATTRSLLTAVLPDHAPRLSAHRWLPVAIVACEAAVVVLVAVPATARIGLGLAAALLTAFTLVTGVAVRRSAQATCLCFGASNTPLGIPHMVRNSVLLLAAVTALAAGPGEFSEIDRVGLVIALGVAAIAAVVIVRLDDLLSLFSPLPGGTPTRDQDRTR